MQTYGPVEGEKKGGWCECTPLKMFHWLGIVAHTAMLGAFGYLLPRDAVYHAPTADHNAAFGAPYTIQTFPIGNVPLHTLVWVEHVILLVYHLMIVATWEGYHVWVKTGKAGSLCVYVTVVPLMSVIMAGVSGATDVSTFVGIGLLSSITVITVMNVENMIQQKDTDPGFAWWTMFSVLVPAGGALGMLSYTFYHRSGTPDIVDWGMFIVLVVMYAWLLGTSVMFVWNVSRSNVRPVVSVDLVSNDRNKAIGFVAPVIMTILYYFAVKDHTN